MNYDISSDPIWNSCLSLLLDDSVSELQANGYNSVFVKKDGRRIQLKDFSFKSEEKYCESIKEGLAPLVNSPFPYEESSYIFEGPLSFVVEKEVNGKKRRKKIRGRCHIVLPPASDTPQITIAKKAASLSNLDVIAQKGSMPEEILNFVKVAIDADLTVVISGGTGAGKTTFLEAMCKHIDKETRMGIAEDTPELELTLPNTTYLHSVPWRPGMDDKDVASLSWVVAQFNRMRTDKIIIGETRGKEFSDFLIAANSGMEGSMTTLHANDPVRALDKMTGFASKGSPPGTPIRVLNKDIATSIDIIIQLAYYKKEFKYRLTGIQEITKTISNNDSAGITTGNLYSYDAEKDCWEKRDNPTDDLRKRFAMKGINIKELFTSTPGTILYPIGSHTDDNISGLPLRSG